MDPGQASPAFDRGGFEIQSLPGTPTASAPCQPMDGVQHGSLAAGRAPSTQLAAVASDAPFGTLMDTGDDIELVP